MLSFYLGVHEPAWLERTTVPLFVSVPRLLRRKQFPKAKGSWALDSGAFTELLSHGRWRMDVLEYGETVERMAAEITQLQWASIQDWLCTPEVLNETGLSIETHQRHTVRNYCKLMKRHPNISWLPVLQGWEPDSYLNHAAMYRAEGVQLDKLSLVGLGSLAGRQKSQVIPRLARATKDRGLKTHVFGLSFLGLRAIHQLVRSADSMVWSFIARRRQLKFQRCRMKHHICNNCLKFALHWRSDLLRCF
jgi:hypothetical protein